MAREYLGITAGTWFFGGVGFCTVAVILKFWMREIAMAISCIQNLEGSDHCWPLVAFLEEICLSKICAKPFVSRV